MVVQEPNLILIGPGDDLCENGEEAAFFIKHLARARVFSTSISSSTQALRGSYPCPHLSDEEMGMHRG